MRNRERLLRRPPEPPPGYTGEVEYFPVDIEYFPADVGEEGYDAGARQLTEFFAACLRPYLDDADLDPRGRRIIEMALDGADVPALQGALEPRGGTL